MARGLWRTDVDTTAELAVDGIIQSAWAHAKEFHQFADAGLGAQIGDAEIHVGIHRSAPRIEQFVFGIEQVEQGALADVELRLVGIPRLLDRAHLQVEVGKLGAQALDIVVGNRQRLAGIAAGLVAQVHGEILAFGIYGLARHVGAAIEYVVAEDDFRGVVLARADGALIVVGGLVAHAQVEPGLKPGTPEFEVMLRGFEVFHRGPQRRIQVEAHFQGGRLGRWKIQRYPDRRKQHRRRRFANQADEARRDVMQVGRLGIQVQFGQCQAAGGMLNIHPPAGAGLGATQELLVAGPMLDIVVFRQQQQQAIAHHVVVGTSGFERRAFRGIDQFEVPGQARLVEPLDVVRGGESVVQHLVQRQCLATAAEITIGNARLPQGLAPGTVGIVNLGQETGPGNIDLAGCGFEGMPFDKNFRIAEDDFLHDVLQRQMGGSQRVPRLKSEHGKYEFPSPLQRFH